MIRWICLVAIAWCFPLFSQECKDFASLNKVLVSEDATETQEWRLEFLRHARHSIEISDSYGSKEDFLEVLLQINALLEGNPELQVHLLLPPSLVDGDDDHLLQVIADRFPDQLHYLITSPIPVLFPHITTIENHLKMLVVDEKYFLIGGATPSTQNADMDIACSGSLAKHLRLEYFKVFEYWEEHAGNRYFPVEDPYHTIVPAFVESPKLVLYVPAKITVSDPISNFQACTQEYIRVLSQTAEHIWIAHLFFMPADAVRGALFDAVKRGASVDLITNGTSSPGADLFAWGNRIHYLPLTRARMFSIHEVFAAAFFSSYDVNIFEYDVPKELCKNKLSFSGDTALQLQGANSQPRPISQQEFATQQMKMLSRQKGKSYSCTAPKTLYHKKVLIADHSTIIIGSCPLSFRADRGSFELVVTLKSEEVAVQMEAALETDRSLSKEISKNSAFFWCFNPFHRYLGEAQKMCY